MKNKYYAVYKGDKFLFIGTSKECAKFFNVKVKTIQFITTKTYKKRMQKLNGNNYKYAIAIEDEKEDEILDE